MKNSWPSCVLLGCIQRSVDSWYEMTLPLCSYETAPGVLCSDLVPPMEERHGIVGAGPAEEVMNLIRGQEHLLYDDRMRKLGLFSLQKRRNVNTSQHLSGSGKVLWEAGQWFFIRNCSDMTKGLKEEKCILNIRKKNYCEGSEALEQIFQRSCDCSIPEIVQGQVGQCLEPPGVVEGDTAHDRGWNGMSFKGPSNPNCSTILLVKNPGCERVGFRATYLLRILTYLALYIYLGYISLCLRFSEALLKCDPSSDFQLFSTWIYWKYFVVTSPYLVIICSDDC